MTTQRSTQEFLEAINKFAWVSDYFSFCEVLDFTPNDYSAQKYAEFRELISYLACFDAETLDKLLDSSDEN